MFDPNNTQIVYECILMDLENIFKESITSKGVRIMEMDGHGNCLFRALAYQLYHDADLLVRSRWK